MSSTGPSSLGSKSRKFNHDGYPMSVSTTDTDRDPDDQIAYKGRYMIPYVRAKTTYQIEQEGRIGNQKIVRLPQGCGRLSFEEIVGPDCPFIGHCRPCVFKRHGKCNHGQSCSYCHFHHPDFESAAGPKNTNRLGKDVKITLRSNPNRPGSDQARRMASHSQLSDSRTRLPR